MEGSKFTSKTSLNLFYIVHSSYLSSVSCYIFTSSFDFRSWIYLVMKVVSLQLIQIRGNTDYEKEMNGSLSRT